MSPAAAGRSLPSASSPNERKRWPGKAIRSKRVFGVERESGKIMKMTFGNAPIELMAGAENAIDVCLGVQPGEHVALIADEISRSVAASLEKALTERGAEFTGLLLEDFGPRPMKGAPGPVLEALETADVGILAMNPQPGELTARMAIVRVVERRRIRYAHMVGVTPQIMQQGMRTDYQLVDQLSDKLRE